MVGGGKIWSSLYTTPVGLTVTQSQLHTCCMYHKARAISCNTMDLDINCEKNLPESCGKIKCKDEVTDREKFSFYFLSPGVVVSFNLDRNTENDVGRSGVRRAVLVGVAKLR